VREILFVAGEASGDLHAGQVAVELAHRRPGIRMVGVGGGFMERAGVQLIEHSERLAVMGFVEVLQHVPKHWMLLRTLEQRITSGSVGLVVLLDYPGFNLKVADVAKRAGVPVLYYITPQVWAWGAGRLPKIAEVVTKAACILPFEESLLRAHGIDAKFVGHPLLDRVDSMPTAPAARATLKLGTDDEVLAVFPGSRRSELSRHLTPFIETAQELQRRRPRLKVLVSVAPTVRITPAECPFPLVHDGSYTVLRAATAGLLKSGTTTLEAAVAGLPHVIGYRTNPVTYEIARRVVKIPRIGLVNVVADREVSREFVQDEFQPAAVADALEPLLESHGAVRQEAIRGLNAVRARLGTPGAAARVADMALGMMA
jgi:lipid-A-disaccharide synthase